MNPSIRQQEHITNAVISLGIMALSTSISYIFTTSHFWLSAKPHRPVQAHKPPNMEPFSLRDSVSLDRVSRRMGHWIEFLDYVF